MSRLSEVLSMRHFPPKLSRRKAPLVMSLSGLMLLAACGGGEDSGLAGFFTITANPGGSGPLGSYFMASITNEWRAAAASFRTNSARFTLQNGTFGSGTVFANPLQSSRVDYAAAVGLTGAGQTIAIVDGGFRTTHETLSGSIVSVTGAPPTLGAGADHGTTVASIAAGDSPTMVGVAPGANLALGYYGTAGVYTTLTAAANDARTRGAVVQNNSWGFGSSPIGTASFNNIFGNTDGAAWLTALESYAATGVVVFAIDNDDTGTAGLMDALPVLRPALQVAWLAVGNAVPIFDDNGVSAVYQRFSSQCYESAQWCLMADGFWEGATAASNTSYGSGTGSSFAAPQVSGAMALLAQAFPSLTPHQLRARLLASADNTFTGFVTAGSVDLLEGTGTFNHNYSTEFGHGFLDIRAALLPIGATSFSVGDGETVATKDYAFSTGGAMGDAVAQSLEGIDVTMNDELGGDFSVAAKAFATAAAPAELAETLAARSFGKDYGATRTAPLNPLADSFAAHPGQTLDLNAPDGMTRASVLMGGSDDYGVALSRTLTEGDLQVALVDGGADHVAVA
jgi:subtilase-type serine protease